MRATGDHDMKTTISRLKFLCKQPPKNVRNKIHRSPGNSSTDQLQNPAPCMELSTGSGSIELRRMKDEARCLLFSTDF